MRTNKNTSKIILALIVAVLATMVSYSAFNNLNKQLKEQKKLITFMQKNAVNNKNKTAYLYAVAVGNLKTGEIISDKDIKLVKFEEFKKGAFEKSSEIVNKVLIKDVASGDILVASDIADVSGDDIKIRQGYRALTLPAGNFQGKSENMSPGTFVDVYNSSGKQKWVLEKVRIISFDNESKEEDKTLSTIKDAKTITFEVSTNDISDFISNVSKGKLVLVTRGANDTVTKKEKQEKTEKTISKEPNIKSLPKLPSIENLSGLPEPIQPIIQSPSVEVIEANVKTKVTFE